MKRWLNMVMMCALAGVPCAVQAGTYTVSQTAGAADYTTISAALQAANDDSSDNDVVRILDSGTYSEDFPRLAGAAEGGTLAAIKTMTIEVAAGQAPVLEKASGTGEAISYAPEGQAGTLTIKGASASACLVLRNAVTTAPVIDTGATTAGTQRVVLENVIVEKPATVGGTLIRLDNANTEPHLLTNVEVRGRDGLNSVYDGLSAPDRGLELTSAGGATLTHCTLHPNGINATMTKNDSTGVALPTSGVNVLAANGPVTFSDCTLASGDANPFSTALAVAGGAATKIVLTNTTVDGFNDKGIDTASLAGSTLALTGSTVGTPGSTIAMNIQSPVAVTLDSTTVASKVAIVTANAAYATLTARNGCTFSSQASDSIWVNAEHVTLDLADSTFTGVKNCGIWLQSKAGVGIANDATINLTNITASGCGTSFLSPDKALSNINVTINGGTFTNNGKYDIAGVPGTTTIKKAAFTPGNDSYFFRQRGGTLNVEDCTLALDGSVMSGNNFVVFYIDTAGCALNVSGSTFTGLDAYETERLIYNNTGYDSTATFTKCTSTLDQLVALKMTDIDMNFTVNFSSCSFDRSHAADGATAVWWNTSDGIEKGTLNLSMTDCDVLAAGENRMFVYDVSEQARIIGNFLRTTMNNQVNAFVLGACANNSSLTFDQCDFMNIEGATAIWIQTGNYQNTQVRVVDTNFENITIAMLNESANNTNTTCDYILQGEGVNGIAGVAVGEHTKDVEAIGYQTTTWGNNKYLALAVDSPAWNFNSGNGKETYAGAKGSGPLINAAQHWDVLE